MEKFLSDLNKIYITLGEKKFSPIMQLSIGLAMNYHEEVNNGLDKPFHLNFPDKQDSALWLSVALMRNFLLEDYINQPTNRIENFGIEKDDKVELFDAVSTYEGSIKNKILLGFSDQDSPIAITNKLVRYVNPTNRKRVNKFRLFVKKKKEARANRNAISKLLEPTEPILVNKKILESKVLVIAGRGESGSFSQRLKEESLYGTSFYDLFNCGENLIIRPDLEDFTFLGKKEDPIVEERFKNRFLKFINELIEELPERKNEIDRLVESVKENDFRTKEFEVLFDEIVSECNPESKYHQIINKYYPGTKEHLPEHLKSVVINDINQLETYRGVVEEFIKRGIPVLVISNRYIEDKKALSFFENYFKTHQKDLRISWDKKKIRELSKPSLKVENPLDNKLWKKCLKFSKQKIKIKTTKSHPVDELLITVQRAVSNLEGQERLKNAYWRYFNPLIYSFKNSVAFESYHDKLLKMFLSVFEEVQITLTQDLRSIFDKIIDEIRANRESFKSFDKNTILFGQHIDFEDQSVIFPKGDYTYITNENFNSSTSQITFPGFPLDEPLNNFLLDSINEHIIQDINIVCWPKEGGLTYHYILNRLKAGYYTENIPEKWKFPNELLLRNEKDIQEEVNETLILDLDLKKDEENNIEADEEILRKISTFKYSAYQGDNSSDSNAKVNCNIIDLQKGQFMFLPKTSSVFAKIETEGENCIIRKAKFSDLKVGDEVFHLDLSRHRLRQLSKDADYKDDIFPELEKWKDSLKRSYEEEGHNLKKLLSRLENAKNQNKLNANPSYQNLRNWLFDEDFLSPKKENLKMIMLSDSNTKLVNEVDNIYSAYKKASSMSRKVSSEIKKMILKKLKSLDLSEKSDFEIQVFGKPLKIEFRKIKGLQKADIEVEYQHTRKIVE